MSLHKPNLQKPVQLHIALGSSFLKHSEELMPSSFEGLNQPQRPAAVKQVTPIVQWVCHNYTSCLKQDAHHCVHTCQLAADQCVLTYSSCRISLMLLSSEIISLATMLKPNSLIDAWTVSLYSGPRTRGLAPSPGPLGIPWGSGSLGSKFPRTPFFSTGLL